MSRSSSATLVPFVSQWSNDEALVYLLHRGPHTIDPNLGKEYANGWYDDGREYTSDEFHRAIAIVANRVPKSMDERLGSARRLANTNDFTNLISGLGMLGAVSLDDRDIFFESFVSAMAESHVHEWHRFRMVPLEVISSWKVSGITAIGFQQYFVYLPALIRSGRIIICAKAVRILLDEVRTRISDRANKDTEASGDIPKDPDET